MDNPLNKNNKNKLADMWKSGLAYTKAGLSVLGRAGKSAGQYLWAKTKNVGSPLGRDLKTMWKSPFLRLMLKVGLFTGAAYMGTRDYHPWEVKETKKQVFSVKPFVIKQKDTKKTEQIYNIDIQDVNIENASAKEVREMYRYVHEANIDSLINIGADIHHISIDQDNGVSINRVRPQRDKEIKENIKDVADNWSTRLSSDMEWSKGAKRYEGSNHFYGERVDSLFIENFKEHKPIIRKAADPSKPPK